jgi:hypothetical protein
MAGNKQNYITNSGCSVSGLSINCPVGGSDGWYSDGTYSYYVTSGLVTSVNTDPCYVAPPPPPAVTWTAITLYRRSTTASGACNFAGGTVGAATFYINSFDLANSTAIAALSDGTGNLSTGYYSDGGYSIYVSGQSISQFSQCTE